MTRIVLEVGDVTLEGELNDSSTAQELIAALPISDQATVWGEEIYFPTPVRLSESEDAQEVVPVGTLAYWPPGSALCVFFGPTPASQDDEPRAYSPVNIVGKVLDGVESLKGIRSGTPVEVRIQQ